MSDATPVAPAEGTPLVSRGAALERLEALLVERNLMDAATVAEIAQRCRWLDDPLESVLTREGHVAEPTLLELLSEISGVALRPISSMEIDPEAIARVPLKVVARFRVMPISLYGGTLTLATDGLAEIEHEDQLRVVLGCSIEWVLCYPRGLTEAVKHYYGVGIEAFVGDASQGHEGDADIGRFVRAMLEDAVRCGATDIHVEPSESGLRLRYRIDGVLTTIPLPRGADDHARAILSSIKVMAQLNIAEKRQPQDGRLEFTVDDQQLDVRVSILPSQHGETANMRILNRSGALLSMDQLGLRTSQLALIRKLLMCQNGIVLFTGATGSGKTTSLYAALSELNNAERKIITIEDPVEYRIQGVSQLQVNKDIDFTFASGLRSILRHDPDVILVGEIRDQETARIAISAAMTGHLVFSTLHTNDSAGAGPRLVDMGIEPYLVASSLQGVIAQQLLRCVCGACKERIELPEAVLEEVRRGGAELEQARFVRGKGCPDCRYTGYHGRKGVFEILVIDDDVRSAVVRREPSTVIRACAVSHGLMTLRESAWALAETGTTSVDEVLRVTPAV